MPELRRYKTAVLKVVNKKGSVRQIALATILKKTTLERHIKNYKKLPDDGKKEVFCVPRYNTKQVCTAERELSLKNYLITSAKMRFGLSVLILFLYVFLQFKFRFNAVQTSWGFVKTKKYKSSKDYLVLQC